MSYPAWIVVALGVVLAAQSVSAQTGPLVLPGAVNQPEAPVSRPAGSQRAPQARSTPAARSSAWNVEHNHNGTPLDSVERLTVVQAVLDSQPGLRLMVTGSPITGAAGAESCAIQLGQDNPVPLLRINDPDSRTRFQLQSPVCPVIVEVMERSVLITVPDGECRFVQANCSINPAGLWGPAAVDLATQTSAIERQRGRAENDMRDLSRRLLRRLTGEEQRAAAAEQAAFSSERSMLCRHYVDEQAHGFCATQITAARVERLKLRLERTPEKPARPR